VGKPEAGAIDGRQVTQLLHAWRGGDKDAEQALMPVVYAQLHAIAMRQMCGERQNHTLCPTELVHEAWLRLDNAAIDFAGRAHFLALSSNIMRRILVDHARARSRVKRFGELERASLDEAELTVIFEPEAGPERLIDLDRVLTRLAEQDSRKGRLMEMTYFGGLTPEESAEVLHTTVRTVQRDIKFAKAWMKAALTV
jgi:RNA polymerase sigma factor (TIGR02999 family)